jgi:hypothetical protein
VVDLAHRREGVVLLPAPDELPYPLDGRRILGDELDGHRIPHVAAVGAGQLLGGGLNLHLYRRRVEREVDGNPRCDLLEQAPAKDIVLEI